MSDDLVADLRFWNGGIDSDKKMRKAADRIEQLETVTKDDAKWLAAYHQWCQMNGCAPSSSDLIAARKELEEKDD